MGPVQKGPLLRIRLGKALEQHFEKVQSWGARFGCRVRYSYFFSFFRPHEVLDIHPTQLTNELTNARLLLVLASCYNVTEATLATILWYPRPRVHSRLTPSNPS
jgi:hypothetical protein